MSMIAGSWQWAVGSGQSAVGSLARCSLLLLATSFSVETGDERNES
jgi:hypothetical protein